MSGDTVRLYDALTRINRTKDALRSLGKVLNFDLIGGREIENFEVSVNSNIYAELAKLSPKLANSYRQVVEDLARVDRYSWAGTAHEIREILAQCLRLMAPDEVVESQANFKPQTDNGKPTQKQRVQYILKNRGENSSVTNMVEEIEPFEDAISNLVRKFYSRASTAAHTHRDRIESARLLIYFEAFANDLFDIET